MQNIPALQVPPIRGVPNNVVNIIPPIIIFPPNIAAPCIFDWVIGTVGELALLGGEVGEFSLLGPFSIFSKGISESEGKTELSKGLLG